MKTLPAGLSIGQKRIVFK